MSGEKLSNFPTNDDISATEPTEHQPQSTGAAQQSRGELDTMMVNETTDQQKNYALDDGYLKTFVLGDFLETIWKNSPESDKFGINIVINSEDKLIEFLVRHLKSKRYIGVGVGGVFIYKKLSGSTEFVLLYKRYHEPENQVWSMLGGSSKIHEKIEDTLKRKIGRLTGMPEDSIEIKDIIRANNHNERNKFHYLSPAFYCELKSISRHLYWDGRSKPKEKDNARKVHKIEKLADFNTIGNSTYDDPMLAWVPITLINEDQLDADERPYFSSTTCKAIERHLCIKKASETILEAAKSVSKYEDWRISAK